MLQHRALSGVEVVWRHIEYDQLTDRDVEDLGLSHNLCSGHSGARKMRYQFNSIFSQIELILESPRHPKFPNMEKN